MEMVDQFLASEQGLTLLISVAVYGLVFGIVAAYVSEQKGRNVLEGFFLGACLGLIGLLVAVMMPTRRAR